VVAVATFGDPETLRGLVFTLVKVPQS